MLESYNKLISTILTPEGRKKFEKAVGAALKGGPKTTLVIEGKAATGKSTLLSIADLVLDGVKGVDICHDGVSKTMVEKTKYLFAASNVPVDFVSTIHTTGATLPVDQYHHLVNQIGAELDAISRRCLAQ